MSGSAVLLMVVSSLIVLLGFFAGVFIGRRAKFKKRLANESKLKELDAKASADEKRWKRLKSLDSIDRRKPLRGASSAKSYTNASSDDGLVDNIITGAAVASVLSEDDSNRRSVGSHGNFDSSPVSDYGSSSSDSGGVD